MIEFAKIGNLVKPGLQLINFNLNWLNKIFQLLISDSPIRLKILISDWLTQKKFEFHLEKRIIWKGQIARKGNRKITKKICSLSPSYGCHSIISLGFKTFRSGSHVSVHQKNHHVITDQTLWCLNLNYLCIFRRNSIGIRLR